MENNRPHLLLAIFFTAVCLLCVGVVVLDIIRDGAVSTLHMLITGSAILGTLNLWVRLLLRKNDSETPEKQTI